jgi:hypothetical protein
MLTRRKFATGDKEVDSIFDTASIIGVNVIEILRTKLSAAPSRIVGYEVPKVSQSVKNFSVDLNTNVKWVTEQVWFYPSDIPKEQDEKMCYGYVFDTPANRRKLAQSMKTGWFKIVDQNIRQEIEQLAKEIGESIEVIAKPELGIKLTAREKKSMSEVDKLKQKLIEMEQKHAEEIKKMIDSGEVKLKAPLFGVKLPKKTEEPVAEKANAN